MADWTINNILRQANDFMREIGFPMPEKPEGYGNKENPKYNIPQDPTKLNSLDLGTWQLRLGAWSAYSLTLLGVEESKLGSWENLLELAVNSAMAEEHGKTKLTKDELRAKIIKDDEKLSDLMVGMEIQRTKVRRIKYQTQIYENSLKYLSREQSRRESEARLIN